MVGFFSVKSAYHLILELGLSKGNRENVDVGSSNNNDSWSFIWSAHVPNKVKHFIWRVCSDSLPTQNNILLRNIYVANECYFCNERPETALHVLCK